MKASLPMSFELSSSGPLIGPKDDGYARAGIKEPSTIKSMEFTMFLLAQPRNLVII